VLPDNSIVHAGDPSPKALNVNLSELDTRAKLIDPAIARAGWGEDAIRREVRITNGRNFLVGDVVHRRPGLIADYILYWKDVPIAVVEAKDNSHHEAAGLQQAKQYAQMLDVKLAFSSNGKAFVEFDYLTSVERTLTLAAFPSPAHVLAHLRQGGVLSTSVDDPLTFPYSGHKEPRYYQDVAVRRALTEIEAGRRRLLLALATGAGKTFIASQVAWKLYKTRRVKRALFLADRIFLRDQAYNDFGFFKGLGGDPRYVIEGQPEISAQYEIYFGMYQSLYSDRGGKPLYLQLPPDFFDLVIVDECHRSGFGTWKEILDYYQGAIQVGLTATPKRTDNIDTYAYFGEPSYSYSLGQGIEDGFLATYKVHRVRTNLDELGGINVEDALVAGAELFVPEGLSPVKDFYSVYEFERKIALPDWTNRICEHLAGVLQPRPMEKTLVFCVNMDHALDVRQQMQNRFASLGLPDYAVRIVSEEHDASAQLADFADPSRRTPVLVTTVDLLSTGVDIPPVRNIVFVKPVGSVVVFKQIVGRGARLDPVTGKQWFRIIDYTNATRLFDDWDRPPGDAVELPPEPWQGVIHLEVINADSAASVPGAWAIAVAAPNHQIELKPSGDYLSGRDLPEVTVEVHVGATDYRTRVVRLPAVKEPDVEVAIVELRPISDTAEQIVLKGVRVEIASEIIVTVDASGRQMTVEEYLAYAKGKTLEIVSSQNELRSHWLDDEARARLSRDLEETGVLVDLIADLYKVHDADGFDVLAHLAVDAPLVRREERLEAFRNRNSNWIASQAGVRVKVILALLETYREGGVGQLRRQVLQIDRFKPFGGVVGVITLFGGTANFDAVLTELRVRLYPKSEGDRAA
jgi:type I restriction enzyme, R subunit